eukprot:GFUD01035074.1.p1 GENE.GFUD01035074.1~~GFUD01035074.1.p1  ORF type:complete len:174 (+),score=17.96 GFUD01035074.1:380-901(+)
MDKIGRDILFLMKSVPPVEDFDITFNFTITFGPGKTIIKASTHGCYHDSTWEPRSLMCREATSPRVSWTTTSPTVPTGSSTSPTVSSGYSTSPAVPSECLESSTTSPTSRTALTRRSTPPSFSQGSGMRRLRSSEGLGCLRTGPGSHKLPFCARNVSAIFAASFNFVQDDASL